MRGLDGRTIIVVAGAGKIGSRICRRLADEGARVAVADLDLGAATESVDAIVHAGGSAIALPIDVTDERSVVDAIDAVHERFGPIHGAHVNVADLSPTTLAADTTATTIDLEMFDHILRVDLRGPLVCTKHLVPELVAVGGGPILYTSSAGAYMAGPSMVAYAMAKSGLNALVRHVASAYGKQGVRANAIAPGLVLEEDEVERRDRSTLDALLTRTFSDRLGRPDDIAGMAALLLSEDGAWINGQVISVDGGLTHRP